MNTNMYQMGEGNEYLSLDYTRCQRPDGSFYGTGGVCRKGSQVSAKEKEAIAKSNVAKIEKAQAGLTSKLSAMSSKEYGSKRYKRMMKQRTKLEEMKNKMKNPKSPGMEKLTTADVQRAVGTQD